MKKLYQYYMLKTNFKRWLKSARGNPKVTAGIIISAIILYILIF
jgi:hypothetical protein